MATVLSQQLRNISLALGRPSGDHREPQASVLYGAAEAADTDTQTVFSNALHGLEQLSRLDPRFLAYQKSLFSPTTLTLDPNKLTKAELDSLRSSVKSFLVLLSPHFLSPGCFKTLEYLIRRYRVQQDAEVLIACGLPFHSTTQFAQLVQACKLENTVWEFLKPMQASGAPLPRQTLVLRCLKDKALLGLICTLAKTAGHHEQANRMVVSLYAVLLCEVLVASPQVDEDLVRLLLPHLLHGLGADTDGDQVTPDYRAASNMVLVQLCSSATLALDFLQVLLQQIARNAVDGDLHQTLMVLIHLSATQPHLQTLSKPVLKALTKLDGTATCLAELQAKKARAQPFIRMLVQGLCQHPKTSANSKLSVKLIQEVDVGFAAEEIGLALLSAAEEKDLDEKPSSNLRQIMRALDLRYPRQADAAINMHLRDKRESEAGKADDGVRKFVDAALAGSARAQLGGTATTLAQGIDSSSSQLRLQAVKQLDDLLDAKAEREFVSDAICRRLTDDDPEVVTAVLNGAAIHSLPAQLLASELGLLLSRSQALYQSHSAGKISKKAYRGVIRQALSLLVDHKDLQDQAASWLLNFGLTTRTSQKLSAHIPELAARARHPAVEGLSTLEAPEGKDLGGWNLDATTKLAASFGSLDVGALEGVLGHLDARGRCLTLLALTLAVKKGSKTAGKAILSLAQSRPETLDGFETAGSYAWDHASGDVPAAAISDAANQAQRAEPSIMSTALLAALNSAQDLDLPEVQGVNKVLASKQPFEAFLPLLAAAVSRMGQQAIKFLADKSSMPSEDQAQALQIMARLPGHNHSDAELLVLVPRIFSALSCPEVRVRTAAVPVLEKLVQEMDTKSLSSRHLQQALKEVLHTSSELEASQNALSEIVTALCKQQSHPVSKGKSAATPSKKGGLSKTASADLTKFLLASLGEQSDDPGYCAALVLLDCLRNAVPAQHLVQAALPLLQSLATEHAQADSKAADLLEQLLHLFTPAALAHSHSSKSEAALTASDMLLGLFGASQKCKLYLGSESLQAALKMMTPELFAALSSEDQGTLTVALLETAAHNPDNAVRLAAQKAIEPLHVQADVLLPLLQAPSLGPSTPTPLSKRAKTSKEPASLQASKSPKATQGKDCWIMLSSVLELLQWKTDIKEGHLLLEPLSQTLRFLLDQLKNMDAGLSEQEVEEDMVSDLPQSNTRLASSDYLMQLVLSAMTQIISNQPVESTDKGVDVHLLLSSIDARPSSAALNAALGLLSRMATLHPQSVLDVTLQVVSAVGQSSQRQTDARSMDIGQAALQALVPAWLSAGRSLSDLVDAATDTAVTLNPAQAVSMMSALLSALPQVDGLCAVLLALVRAVAGKSSKKADNVAGSSESLMDLASELCVQVRWHHQLAAFRDLLAQALHESKDRPESRLVVCATGLVTAGINGRDSPGDDDAPSLQEVYLQIVQLALQQLQLLGSKVQREGGKGQTAAQGVIALLEALEGVMQAKNYFAALLQLLEDASPALVPQVLRLYEACLAKGADGAAAETALQFCGRVPDLLTASSPSKAKQRVLSALRSLAAHHGSRSPGPFIPAISSVLQQATGSSGSLRTGALATIADMIAALKQAVLPTLPRVVPIVLSAAAAAIDQLPVSELQDSENVNMDIASASGKREHQGAEIGAALSAIKACVDNLGAYLSPYLASILTVLLRPATVDPDSIAAESAAAIRTQLPVSVPARLLLPALLGHLPAAVQEGETSVVELLRMVNSAVEGLTPQNASAHCSTVWASALQVLGYRQDTPPKIQRVRPIEDAAIQLVLTLTLKLTESSFKPLFLRLIDWAAQPPVTGGASADRQIVLFKLANALADQLRGVFSPYFKSLADLMVGHLGGSKATVSGKRKRKTASGLPEYDGPDAPFLRLQVVRAVQKAFQYGQEPSNMENLFNRLLSPVTAQLAAELPQDIQEREMETPESAPDSLDVMGNAVVSALVQMGASSGNEGLLKPLHHKVLMATRSEGQMERKRAVEVICQLVDRMQEEYVILLPEAMPFLAELLEDPELGIQNKARQLLRQLEAITGESLDEYLKT